MPSKRDDLQFLNHPTNKCFQLKTIQNLFYYPIFTILKYSKFQQMLKVNLAYRQSKQFVDQGNCFFANKFRYLVIRKILYTHCNILERSEYFVRFKAENESFLVKMEF